MNTIRVQMLTVGVLLAAGLGMTVQASQDAAVGRIFYVEGGVTLTHNGKASVVNVQRDVTPDGNRATLPQNVKYQGSGDWAVYSGDAISTGENGQAQWRMGDQSYLGAWKSSDVKIAKFAAGEQGAYALSRGGVRILAGMAPGFSLKAPLATVQTDKGADITGVVCKKNCYHNSGELYPDGFYLKVAAGNVTVSSQGVATAGNFNGRSIRLADASGSLALHTTMSDASPIRVAEAANSLTVGGVTYVYVGAGAPPKVLPAAPDFFLKHVEINFHIGADTSVTLRNLFNQGGGNGGSTSPTTP